MLTQAVLDSWRSSWSSDDEQLTVK